MASKKRSTSKSKKPSPAADPQPDPIVPAPAADPIPQNPKRKPKKPQPSSPQPTPSDTPNPSHSTPNPNPNPNPNPSPSPNPKKPKISPPGPASPPKPKPTPMTTDADPAAAASPRKSERKRKAREFPDEETPASPNQYNWSDDESLNLLRAVAHFRAKTGTNPVSAAFFDSVKAVLPNHVTQDQVLNKIRRLRQKFRKSAADDTQFYKLSVKAWGGDAANDHSDKENGYLKEEEGGGGGGGGGEDIRQSCPILIRRVSEYWKELGYPEELINKACKFVDPAEAKALESQWREHCSAQLKLEAKRSELDREIYSALAEARGTSP